MELVVTTTRRPGAPVRRRRAASSVMALAALGCSDLRYSSSVFVIFALLHRGVEVDQDARVP